MSRSRIVILVAACDFGQNGVGATATAGGGDPQGVAAGLRYTF